MTFSFVRRAIWLVCVSLCFAQLVIAQEAHPERRPISKEVDRLYDAAVVASLSGQLGKAHRLLLMAYDIVPSAVVAGTLGKLLPESESLAKVKWLEKAVSLAPDHLENVFSLTFLYSQQRRFSEASTLLEGFITRNPDQEEARFYLASIYGDMGNYDKATTILTKLITDGSNMAIRQGAEQLLLRVYMASGNQEKLKEQIVAGIDLSDPQTLSRFSSEELLSKVEELTTLGAYQEALDLLRATGLAQEGVLPAIELQATLHLLLEDREQAIKTLEQLIALSSVLPQEKTERLVSILSYDKELRTAHKEYLPLLEQFARENPSSLEANKLFLTFLFTAQSTPAYEEQLTTMVKFFPEEQSLAVELMVHYLQTEQYKLANDVFQESIQRNAQHYGLYEMMAISLSLQGKTDEAIAIISQGIEAIPLEKSLDSLSTSERISISKLYTTLGDLYYQEGGIEASYEAYEKGLRYSERNAILLNNYAYHLALEGRELKKALELASKAVSIMPKSENILDTYVYTLLLNKDYLLAEIYIRQAIELSPQDASLYDRYAEVLLAQGKIEEAVKQLTKAQELASDSERQALLQKLSLELQETH